MRRRVDHRVRFLRANAVAGNSILAQGAGVERIDETGIGQFRPSGRCNASVTVASDPTGSMTAIGPRREPSLHACRARRAWINRTITVTIAAAAKTAIAPYRLLDQRWFINEHLCQSDAEDHRKEHHVRTHSVGGLRSVKRRLSSITPNNARIVHATRRTQQTVNTALALVAMAVSRWTNWPARAACHKKAPGANVAAPARAAHNEINRASRRHSVCRNRCSPGLH